MVAMYGHEKELPDRSMSRMRVSIGVFPTRRTKNSCSITCELTVRNDGSRRSSLPKRVGWFGYWLRQYSSRAHWDFSCRLSMCGTSDKPHASAKRKEIVRIYSNKTVMTLNGILSTQTVDLSDLVEEIATSTELNVTENLHATLNFASSM